MTIYATICYPIKNGKVLLIKKSPGRFGEGKWNGLGGKIEKNETPEECAIRESFEESGLQIRDLKNHGIIEFYEDDKLSWVGHAFSTNNFSGKAREREEGELQWFDANELPFNKMWEDNVYWVPLVMSDRGFNAKFYFTKDFKELLKHSIDIFDPNEEKEIQKMINKLENESFENLERHATMKRLEWFKKNKNKLNLKGSEVKKAYELLLKYMVLHLNAELSQKELPIIEESNKKIVWRSSNFCPVVEACRRLGLDTKKVCKKIYEKSTQEMISQLNQKLKFRRNYDKIRPYYDYCEEWVELGD